MKKILFLVLVFVFANVRAQINNCDVNYDNEVNTADVTAIYNNIINGDVPQKPVMGRKSFKINGCTFYMEPIEGGSFMMGATLEQEEPSDDEKPVHPVTLSSYYMGQLEVTQELWMAVMGSDNNPSYFTHGGRYPVERVSWNDCQTFLLVLNLSLINKLDGMKFRLPTEAEWEFAARGGNKRRGYQYSGWCGNSDPIEKYDLNDYAWYEDNSDKKTHPCGDKYPNELGLYDMSGNVYEWCQDGYTDYSSSAQTNPILYPKGSNKVRRGGSWWGRAKICSTTDRAYAPSGYTADDTGFRLVLSH